MSQTSLRLRVVPRIPSNLVGANGITVERDNIDFVVKNDYGSIAVVPLITDPDHTFVMLWNEVIDNYQCTSFTDVINNVQDNVLGPNLSGIAALTIGANQALYYLDNLGNAATYTVSDYVRSVSNAVDTPSYLTAIGAATTAQGAKADKFSLNVSSTSRFGMDSAGGMFIHEQPTTVPSVKVGIALRTQSDLTYTGGTPGTVASGHNNSVFVGAGVADFVWAGLDVLNNNATGGQNVARYAQSTKNAVGPTWAGVFELQETVDVASLGGGATAIEVDLFGNGANNALNRVALDVVFGKNNAGGTSYTAGYGLRFTPITGQATLLNGIYFNGAVTNGIRLESTGTYGIWFGSTSSHAIGINFSNGAFSAAPIRLAADQKIQLIGDGSIGIGYESTGTKIAMRNSGLERVSFDMGIAAMRINGTIVVGPRVTGWVSDTGTAKRTANATYSATAEATYTQATIQTLMNEVRDLSQTVKALKDDLIAHGLIGA